MNGQYAEMIQTTETANNTARTQSDEDVKRALKNKDMDKTEAQAAAQRQKDMMELGQKLLKEFLPVLEKLTGWMTKLIHMVHDAVDWLGKHKGAMKALEYAVLAVTAGFVALKTVQGYQSIRTVMKGGMTSELAEKIGGGGGVSESVAGKGGSAMSGVASGAKNIGSAMGSISKGVGDIIKNLLTGLAGGLKALGDPKALLGTVTLAGVGGALWVSAKAFKEFAGVEWADALIGVGVVAGIAALAAFGGEVAGLGLAALGAGLLVFSGGLWLFSKGIKNLIDSGATGEQLPTLGKNMLQFMKDLPYVRMLAAAPGTAAFGLALPSLATGLKSLQDVDTAKLNAVADSIARLRDATPKESVVTSAWNFVKSALTNDTTKSGTGTPASGTTTAGQTGTTGAQSAGTTPVTVGPTTTTLSPQELIQREMQMLNKQTADLLKAIKETADNTKRTASLIASNGNLLRA
jgi:hypothetical protein